MSKFGNEWGIRSRGPGPDMESTLWQWSLPPCNSVKTPTTLLACTHAHTHSHTLTHSSSDRTSPASWILCAWETEIGIREWFTTSPFSPCSSDHVIYEGLEQPDVNLHSGDGFCTETRKFEGFQFLRFFSCGHGEKNSENGENLDNWFWFFRESHACRTPCETLVDKRQFLVFGSLAFCWHKFLCRVLLPVSLQQQLWIQSLSQVFLPRIPRLLWTHSFFWKRALMLFFHKAQTKCKNYVWRLFLTSSRFGHKGKLRKRRSTYSQLLHVKCTPMEKERLRSWNPWTRTLGLWVTYPCRVNRYKNPNTFCAPVMGSTSLTIMNLCSLTIVPYSSTVYPNMGFHTLGLAKGAIQNTRLITKSIDWRGLCNWQHDGCSVVIS